MLARPPRGAVSSAHLAAPRWSCAGVRLHPILRLQLLHHFDRWLTRLFSARRTIAGFPTYITAPPDSEALVVERLEAAIALLQTTRPRWVARHRPLISALEVGPLLTVAGQWVERRKTIALDADFLCNTMHPVFQLASTIVHEATHARIEKWGVAYRDPRNVRIEEACLKQQQAFLRELPADDLTAWALGHLADVRANAGDLWSVERGERRIEEALMRLNVPLRLIRLLMRYRQWWLQRRAV